MVHEHAPLYEPRWYTNMPPYMILGGTRTCSVLSDFARVAALLDVKTNSFAHCTVLDAPDFTSFNCCSALACADDFRMQRAATTASADVMTRWRADGNHVLHLCCHGRVIFTMAQNVAQLVCLTGCPPVHLASLRHDGCRCILTKRWRFLN